MIVFLAVCVGAVALFLSVDGFRRNPSWENGGWIAVYGWVAAVSFAVAGFLRGCQ